MSDPLVVVTDHDFDDLSIERTVLGDLADVRTLEGHGKLLEQADGVLVLRAELDRSTICSLETCRVIARYGIGVDNVDIDAATEHGIYVTNAPDYCIEEVSTHALGLTLALVRSIPSYDRSISGGAWEREVGTPIHRFSTLTVGVVGFGTIGRLFGKRAADLGAGVIAHDPYVDDEGIVDYEVALLDFEEVLERSDVVSIHSPLTESTEGLFDHESFQMMRDDAYLVNASRGAIVDGEALLAALEADEIAGAGLDVFPEEPPAVDDPLRDHESVLTTPHVGWYSEESVAERRQRAAECVRQALTGHRPANLINENVHER